MYIVDCCLICIIKACLAISSVMILCAEHKEDMFDFEKLISASCPQSLMFVWWRQVAIPSHMYENEDSKTNHKMDCQSML